MAIDKFNSVDGFSTGFPPRQLADASGNVSANALTASNGANIAGNTLVANLTANGNVTLGAVGNVHITGGTIGQVISTDGNGNLSFTTPAAGVAGSNTQVQYNDAGTLAGAASLTFNKTNNVVTAANTLQANVLAVSANVGNNSVNAVSITANATTNAYTLTLPTSTGAAGQAMVTDGTGKLSFANITAVGGTNTQVQYNDAGNLSGSNAFTFNKTNNTVSTVNSNVSGALNVTGNASVGNLAVVGDATINGNLAVNGNVTYINSNVTTLEDPVFQIGGGVNGAPLTSNTLAGDRGVIMQNFSDASNAAINEFMGWKQGTSAGVGEFVLASNASLGGTGNNTVTVNTYGNLRAGGLNVANANITSNLTVANANVTNSLTANAITASLANVTTANISNLVGGNANLTGNVTANYYSGNGYNLTGVVHNAAGNTTAVQYNSNGNFAGNTAAFYYNDANTTLLMRGTPFNNTTFANTPTSPIGITYGRTSNASYGNSYLMLDTRVNNVSTTLSPIYTSNNGGVSWTFTNANTNQQMYGAAFGNGYAITVGINGTISRTSDLNTWSANGTGVTTANLTAISYANVTGGPVFIAVGDNGTIITSADNGATWSLKTSNTTTNLTDVMYDGSYFNVVGANGLYLYSSDAASWNALPITDLAGKTLNGVAFDGQANIYAVSDGGYIASINATNRLSIGWSTRKISDANLTGITYSGNSASPWLAISADDGTAYIANRALNDGSYFNVVHTGLPVQAKLTGVASNGVGFMFSANGFYSNTNYNTAYSLNPPTVGTVDADEANVFHLKVTGVAQLGDVSRVGIDGGFITPAIFGAVSVDANGTITNVAITNGGAGYDVAPTLSITGTQTGNTNAPAYLTATVSGGAITAVNVLDGGNNYQANTVQVRAGELTKFLQTDGVGNLSWYSLNPQGALPRAGGSDTWMQYNSGNTLAGTSFVTFNPTGNANASIPDNLFTVRANTYFNSPNVTYNSVSNIHIPGGAGVQATAGTPVITSNSFVSIPVSTGGSGYDYAPAVTITGSNTSIANVTAVIANGAVTSLTVVNGGAGYDPANVAISIAAPRTKFLKTNGAGNLSWSETPPSTGGTAITGGSNTQIQYNDNGVLAGSPSFTFDKANTVVASNANINFTGANVSIGKVANLHITGGNANGAVVNTVSVFGNGALNAITLTSGGDGYTISPKVTISGANTIPAVVTANLDANGTVTGFNIVNAGLGYASGTVTATVAAPTSKFLQTNGAGNLSWNEVPQGAQVAGTDKQVQYNNSGTLAASAAFAFNYGSNTLTIGNANTGYVSVQGNANTAAGIQLGANNGTAVNTVDIKPSLATANNANWTLTLPANAGVTNQFLQTNGSGNATWATPSLIATGTNSNVITTAANVKVSANGQANIVNVSSNGTFAQTTIQNDVTITGNLNVTGNINYTDITGLSVIEPIIDIGTGANGSPLTTSDAYDRGQAYHFYNANLIQTTVNASITVGSNLVTLPSTLSFTGIANGLAFYANAANGDSLFPVNTVISNVDSANHQITVNANAVIAGSVSDVALIGSDVLNFAGFHQSSGEFVFGTNVAISSYVATIPTNNYGNLRANNFIGSLSNGNSNLSTTANGNMTFNVTGVNNVAKISNNAVLLGNSIPLTLQSNISGTQRSVNIAASTNAAFGANWTMTVPYNNGYAYGATLGAITLDANGGVNAIAIANAGFGYTIAPIITVTGSNSRTAFLTSTINAAGSVTTLTVQDGGLDYTSGTVGATISAPNPKYLFTDGNGVTEWKEVQSVGGSGNTLTYEISNGSSNVFVYYSGPIGFSYNGQANVLQVTSTNVNTIANITTTRDVNAAGNVIGNTASFANGLTVGRSANFANANVTFANTNAVVLPGGNTHQFLSVSGTGANGNVKWANGSIQYFGLNQYGNTANTAETTTQSALSSGATTVTLSNELWSYSNTGLTMTGTSLADANVVVSGDARSNVSTGNYIKIAANANTLAQVYQIQNVVYDSGNSVSNIVIGTHSSSITASNIWLQSSNNYWDFGNTIPLANSTSAQVQIFAGNTQVVFGTDTPNVGKPNNAVTITSISHSPDYANSKGTVVTFYPAFSGGTILSGANVIQLVTTGQTFVEQLAVANSLTANANGTVLTLGVDPANIPGIGNGTTNVFIPAANGNIYVNVSGSTNVAVFSNGNITTNNTNVNINNGNLNVANVLNANIANVTDGRFGNILVYGNTKTHDFWTSGSITGGTLLGANVQPNGNAFANLPTPTLVGGGGTGAQISTGWAYTSNNSWTVTGISIVNAGTGYTSLPSLVWANTANATIIANGTLALTSNIGTIANVHIAGGSNNQFIQTDGQGNLSFVTPGSNIVTGTNYGTGFTGTPDINNAFLTFNSIGPNYTSGTVYVDVQTLADYYDGAALANIFVPNTVVTFGNNVWYTVSNVAFISGNSANGYTLAQLGINPPLLTDTVNGTLTLLGNATTVRQLANGNNISVTYNAGNIAALNAVPSGSNQQVQYNANGAFAGNSQFTYNAASNTLTVINANLPVYGNLTANGNVTFATAQSNGNANTYVTFGSVGRIVIPSIAQNSAAIDGTSVVVNAIGAIQNTITLVSGFGFGYDPNESPIVSFSGPNTQIATGVGVVNANGYVTSINVTSGGLGYSNANIVATIAAPLPKFLTTADSANANSVLAWKPTPAASAPTIANPAGGNRNVQFNDNGVMAGSNAFVFNKSLGIVSVSNTMTVGSTGASGTNTSISLSAIGNAITVSNTANINERTVIGNNFINVSALEVIGYANIGNRAVFGNTDANGNVGNDNVTISFSGITLSNAANASIKTVITNSNVQTTNITTFNNGNVNFNLSGNVTLGNVANLHIRSNAQNQYRFLQTDGTSNVYWANGWFQYQPNPQPAATGYATSATSGVGNNTITFGVDLALWTNSGVALSATLTQGDANAFVPGDQTSTLTTGFFYKIAPLDRTLPPQLVDSITFDSPNNQTVLTVNAGWPFGGAIGDEIILAPNPAVSIYDGNTISFTGSSLSPQYVVDQFSSFTAVAGQPQSVLLLTTNLLQAVPTGTPLYTVDPVSPDIIETVSSVNESLVANIDIGNRTLDLAVAPVSSLSNGTSNIRVLQNGNVVISSNNVANILNVNGNGTNTRVILNSNVTIANGLNVQGISNITSIAGNGNIAISGNLAIANTANFAGNIVATGAVVNIGDVANLVITGGANGQVLTVANANTGNYKLTWASATGNSISSQNVASGANSNLYFDANAGAMHIGISNRANAIISNGNATYTLTTLSDDLIVTGNLTVNGTTHYVAVDNLSVADPIINLGVNGTGGPLTSNDGKDRGVVDHFFGANLVTTANGAAPAGNTIFKLQSLIGAAVGQPVFALDANGNAAFASTTVVSNVDVANNRITTNAASLYTIASGAAVTLGQDLLNYAGWSVANNEFVFASNVSVNNFVVSYTKLANVQANYVLANVKVGNANIIGDGNGWAFSAANTANFLVANNNNVSITANITNVAANTVNVAANIVKFTSPNVTFPVVANVHIFGGNANAAVLGAVTLDANGTITNIAITSGGDGYTVAPAITVTGSNVLSAYVTSTINASGSVNGLTIVDGGFGYSSVDVVATAASPASKFLKTDGNGNLSWAEVSATGGGGGAGAPGGNNRSIQYNDNGVLNGSARFTYDNSSNTVSISAKSVFTGNVAMNAPNVSLGSNATLHITGGANGSYLRTDGTGKLTWADDINLNPFIRFDVVSTGNNQQFTNNNIANLGNSNFYNVTKDGVMLQPLVDWQLVSANTIQVNVPLRAGSQVDILATATDGLAGRGTNYDPPSYLQAYTTNQQIISSVSNSITWTDHSALFGTSIQQTTGTGLISLAPNRTYKLSASIPTLAKWTGTPSTIAIGFWDNANNIQIGSSQLIYAANSTSGEFASGGSVEAVVTPDAQLNVTLRILAGVGSGNAVVLNDNTQFTGVNQNPWVEVLDITGLDVTNLAPSGASGALQYNNGGNWGGTGNLTFDPTGNGTLTSYGNINFANANVLLGTPTNVHIGGGSVGQFLTTDGSGNLSWATVSTNPTAIVNGSSNVTVAANGVVSTAVHGIPNVQVISANGVTYASNAGVTIQAYNGTTVQSIGIIAPQNKDFTANYTLTLPTTPGESGQALITDGSGTLSWGAGGGGGGYSPSGTPILLVVSRGFNIRVPTFVGGLNGYIKVFTRNSGEIDVPLA